MTTTDWTPLPDDATAVWSLDLDRVVAGRLPPEEELRAGRFQRAIDAARWRAGRWALRLMLGRQLGLAAADVPLVIGVGGKPALFRGGPGFNVSAIGREAVMAMRGAVTKRGAVTGNNSSAENGTVAVGVDLQTTAVTANDLQAIADGPLPPAATSAPQARWARLEAVLKCVGRGFGQPVAAGLLTALGSAWGSVRIDGRMVWWRDLPHHAGALCLASDAPLARVAIRPFTDAPPVGHGGRPAVSVWPPQRLATDLGIEVSEPR